MHICVGNLTIIGPDYGLSSSHYLNRIISSGPCRRERWMALLLLAWRRHSGDSNGSCRRERWTALLLLAWRRHSGDSSGSCRRERWTALLLLAWRRHSGDSSGSCRRERWTTLLLLTWRRHSGDSSGPSRGEWWMSWRICPHVSWWPRVMRLLMAWRTRPLLNSRLSDVVWCLRSGSGAEGPDMAGLLRAWHVVAR